MAWDKEQKKNNNKTKKNVIRESKVILTCGMREEGIRRADEARLLEPRKPKLRLHLHRYRRLWHSSWRTKDRQRTAAAAENGWRI